MRGWEVLVEDAKRRKTEQQTSGGEGDYGIQGEKAMHELTATELYEAHAVSGLVRAERELTGKLNGIQEENKDMSGKIEAQREEMRRLVAALESLVADVEGAAGAVEGDEMRADIKKGVSMNASVDEAGDVKMGG